MSENEIPVTGDAYEKDEPQIRHKRAGPRIVPLTMASAVKLRRLPTKRNSIVKNENRLPQRQQQQAWSRYKPYQVMPAPSTMIISKDYRNISPDPRVHKTRQS
jgi:hypothetical protein